jgi:WW domain
MSGDSNSLSALLDIIESKRKVLPQSSGIVSSSSQIYPDNIPKWSKHFDPSTQLYYYVNNYTSISQWEVPPDFVESGTGGLVSSVSSAASFNAKSGSISAVGVTNHYERQGRAADREGRQLGAFFDLNSFDQNREEAAEKKRKLQNSGINWKEYKEEKKKKRFRLKNSWLYEED